MNKHVKSLLHSLEDFKKTHESVGLELRLSFAEFIIDQLDQKGWTQKQLAKKAGMKEPAISRVIHSDANCTFETAGKLIWALGIRAKISEVTTDVATEAAYSSGPIVKASTVDYLRLATREETNVQEDEIEQVCGWAETGEIAIQART